MELTRRGFLKLSGVGLGGLALSQLGFITPALAAGADLRILTATESTTVCPYCSVGCSAIVSVMNGKVVNVEGLPESPINRGTLCTKGNSLFQVSNSDRRLTKVRFRDSGAGGWKEISWDQAIEDIAAHIKETRDANFVTTQKNAAGADVTVNRTKAIANLGGAALDNEELHLEAKFARSLGLVFVEHQARI
ncbi:MAG: twin-arginine translocation signal domain-containing protein [Endomicrobiales bacterium]